MNKQEILAKLNELELDKNRIVILSGASLVMQNMIEKTEDIDLTTDREYYDSLKWDKKDGAFGIEIKYKDCYEIGYNLQHKPEEITKVEGYNCSNLEKILEIKKALNRPKDAQTIKKIENDLKTN